MGHTGTFIMMMPFGKHKGESLSEIPSKYLEWLTEENWFEEKFPKLLDAVQKELQWRTETGQHWD